MFQLPRDCRLYRKLSPATEWGWSEILANKTTYLLELLLWQNSPRQKGKRKPPKPTPFTPDFMKTPSEISKEAEVHTVDEIKAILARPRGKNKKVVQPDTTQ